MEWLAKGKWVIIYPKMDKSQTAVSITYPDNNSWNTYKAMDVYMTIYQEMAIVGI